jgi:probable F420-dependent oxidoreductase
MAWSIGLSVYDMPVGDLLELSVAADRLGFDAIWLGEHVVLPVGYESEHPTTEDDQQHHHIAGPIVDPDTNLVDQFTAFGAIAARTVGLRLATGIYLSPLRHPLMTARSVCTLQAVSDGRLLLGVGAGWLEAEFDALDVPFDGRMARFEEGLGLLREALAGGPFEHSGRFYETGKVQVTAEPVDLPLILGGNSDKALLRAALLGDGWFSSGTPSRSEAIRLREELLDLRRAAGLPVEDFRTYVRVAGADVDELREHADAGLDDLVVWADEVWRGETYEERNDELARAATAFGLAPRTP